MVGTMSDDNKEAKEEEPDEEDIDTKDEGGEETTPAAPVTPTPRPPPQVPSVPASTVPRRVQQRPLFQRRPVTRPIKKPSYDEVEPAEEGEEEETDGGEAPLFHDEENIYTKRRNKLKTVIGTIPKMDKNKILYVLEMSKDDNAYLSEPRLLFDLLAELEGVNPRHVRRAVDIIFASADTDRRDPSLYAPSYGSGGSRTTPGYNNPYDGSGGSTGFEPDRNYLQRRPGPFPSAPPGMVSQEEMAYRLQNEREMAELRADNKRLRESAERRPAPAPASHSRDNDIVRVKKPIMQEGVIVDYIEEEIPRDIYIMRTEQERNERLLAMRDEMDKKRDLDRQQLASNPPPTQNAELVAMKQEMEKLRNDLSKKDKENESSRLEAVVGSKISDATKAMAEMNRTMERRLEQVESNKGTGGMMSDEAQVIVAEIRHGTDLTKVGIQELSKTANNWIDVSGKARTPNKRRSQDRREYKDELEDDEVRVLHEDLEDGDVEED